MRSPRSSRTSTPTPDADVIYSDEDKLDLAGRALRSVLQARLVARALPDLHVHVPSHGGSPAADERDRRVPRRATKARRTTTCWLRLMRAHHAHPTTCRASSITGASCRSRRRARAGQAVGARRRTAGARGLRAAQQPRRRGAARAAQRGSSACGAGSPDRRSCRSSFRPPAGARRSRHSRVDMLGQCHPQHRRSRRRTTLRADRRRRRRRACRRRTTSARCGARATASCASRRLGPFNFSRRSTPASPHRRASTCCCSTTTWRRSRRTGCRRCSKYSQEPAIGAVGAQAALSRRPAAARRDGARRRRRRGARLPPAPRRLARLRRQRHRAQLLGRDRGLPDDAARRVRRGRRLRRTRFRSTSTTSTTACASAGPAIASSSRRGRSSTITSRRASARAGRTWPGSPRCGAAGARRHRPRSVLQSQPDPRFPGLPARCLISTPGQPPRVKDGACAPGGSASRCSSASSSCRSWPSQPPARDSSCPAGACSKSSSPPRADVSRRSSGAPIFAMSPNDSSLAMLHQGQGPFDHAAVSPAAEGPRGPSLRPARW